MNGWMDKGRGEKTHRRLKINALITISAKIGMSCRKGSLMLRHPLTPPLPLPFLIANDIFLDNNLAVV